MTTSRMPANALAVTLLVLAVLSAAALVSCGGGGGGGSQGGLCDQCGDTDGPCISPTHIDATDAAVSLCNGATSCDVELTCLRKLDSAQRRCFPFAANRNFECDGAKANGSTPTPSDTPTPTRTLVPSVTSTGPTATGPTPTATGPTPTGNSPSTAATPTVVMVEFDVDATIDNDNSSVSGFTITATYPTAKGTFRIGGANPVCTAIDANDVSAPVSASDSGGTLTLTVNQELQFIITVTCPFAQVAGAELVDGDINPTSNDPVNLDVSATVL